MVWDCFFLSLHTHTQDKINKIKCENPLLLLLFVKIRDLYIGIELVRERCDDKCAQYTFPVFIHSWARLNLLLSIWWIKINLNGPIIRARSMKRLRCCCWFGSRIYLSNVRFLLNLPRNSLIRFLYRKSWDLTFSEISRRDSWNQKTHFGLSIPFSKTFL